MRTVRKRPVRSGDDAAQSRPPINVAQIVFGTDYPYRTSEDHVKGLAQIFGAADLRAIEYENPLRILPRQQALQK